MNPANGTTLEELKNSEPLEIKDTVMLRMSKIVDELIEDNEIFRNIDKSALIEFSKITPQRSYVKKDLSNKKRCKK